MGVDRQRRRLAWGIAATLVVGVGARAFGGRDASDGDAGGADDPAPDICTAEGIRRIDTALAAPDRRLAVDVPLQTPGFGESAALAVRARKNEVIEFVVSSARPGSVAVHGLLENRPVVVGGELHVAIRTVYTGRFPLHFHGDDGSHFEIAAVEVRPAQR